MKKHVMYLVGICCLLYVLSSCGGKEETKKPKLTQTDILKARDLLKKEYKGKEEADVLILGKYDRNDETDLAYFIVTYRCVRMEVYSLEPGGDLTTVRSTLPFN